MTLSIDATYIVQTTADLVRINSCNPSLTPGSPGEAEVGAYVAEAMTDLGLEVFVHELAPQRVNVVGIRRGNRRSRLSNENGRSLMWNAHLDTVGVEGMEAPFSGEVREGKIYGRGSQDMKGSLAAMLAAVKALQDGAVDLQGDLILTAVADEEYASLGTEDIVRHYTADAAIVTEPTDLALCRAHRGFVWYEVETTGRAAHGSRYQEGIDAIMHMGRLLARLDRLEQELRTRSPHPLAGPPSLHASIIKGGSELSVYPARCRLQLERRTIPGETAASAAKELQSIVDQLSAQDAAFCATVHAFFDRRPFEVADTASIVRTVDELVGKRLGRPPQHVGATFWTDAALLAEAGIETLILGPVGEGLHSAQEWVDIESLVDLSMILAETAVQFCGTASA